MQYEANGNNIPNEYPDAAIKSRDIYVKNANEARREAVALKHYLGGDGRLYAHPFVEPEVMVEDPELGYRTVSIDNIPNHQPNLFHSSQQPHPPIQKAMKY